MYGKIRARSSALLQFTGLELGCSSKKTGVELELLTDQDMYLFIERGMRGGFSIVGKRYAKANNPLAEGYDPGKPRNYIIYLDANNLYGLAMSLPLPKRGFKWKRVMPTEEQIMKMNENSKEGWILEVDLEYSEDCTKNTTVDPLASEKNVIEKELMSVYQMRLMEDLKLDRPNSETLVLTLEDKKITSYTTGTCSFI